MCFSSMCMCSRIGIKEVPGCKPTSRLQKGGLAELKYRCPSQAWGMSENVFPSKGQGENKDANRLPNGSSDKDDNPGMTGKGSQGLCQINASVLPAIQ